MTYFSVDDFAKVDKDAINKFRKLLCYSGVYVLKGQGTNYIVADSLYDVLKEKEMYVWLVADIKEYGSDLRAGSALIFVLVTANGLV